MPTLGNTSLAHSSAALRSFLASIGLLLCDVSVLAGVALEVVQATGGIQTKTLGAHGYSLTGERKDHPVSPWRRLVQLQRLDALAVQRLFTDCRDAEARNQYLRELREECGLAPKAAKIRLLDEAAKRTGLARKAIIRKPARPAPLVRRPRAKPRRTYDQAVAAAATMRRPRRISVGRLPAG